MQLSYEEGIQRGSREAEVPVQLSYEEGIQRDSR